MVKKMIFSLGLVATLSFGANLFIGMVAYEKGDYKTALPIFEELALKGDAEAQNHLGVMYENGQGVKKDYLKAIEWYEKSVNQGDEMAQYNLGVVYHDSKGVRQDYKKAKEWFGKACDNGFQIGCDEYKKLNQQGY